LILKKNRYSINALLSALEKENLIEEIPIYFFKDKLALLKGIEELWKKFEKNKIAFSFLQRNSGI
jgi:hypothetical protein